MARTSTHAILVKVRFGPDASDIADKVLHEQVIPNAARAHGFVAGYWMHSDDGTWGTSTELFDSRANAEAELGRRTDGPPPDVPVEVVSADVVTVVGSA
jgi:hypothetical protein